MFANDHVGRDQARRQQRSNCKRIPPDSLAGIAARRAESSNSESMRPQFAEIPFVIPLAPCKLISHLAANPSADITQIPIPTEGANDLDEREGVECSRAYQMLMPYGTTVAKLDNIAFTLETRCRKNPKGGCSIPKGFMYKTLDELLS